MMIGERELSRAYHATELRDTLPGLLLAELGLDAGLRWACTEALVALHPDAAANAAVSPPPSEVPDLLEF